MSVWRRLLGNEAQNDPSDHVLDRAVRELRAASEIEQLSPKSRAFLVEELMSANGAPAPWGMRHVVRLALGAVPVVLAAVLVISVGDKDRNGPDWVKVDKIDGHVVFTLADSSKSHRVLASSDVRRFAGARELRTVSGEVQVTAAEESRLIFYRVD